MNKLFRFSRGGEEFDSSPLEWDPFVSKFSSFVPERMVKVDFAFWTGTDIVAVEIDGSSHIGSQNHVTKDRLLQRAGVNVIHILNDELLKHHDKVITKLMPPEISKYWVGNEDSLHLNPLDIIPF